MKKEFIATFFSIGFLTLFGLMNFYVFEHISAATGWHHGMLYHFLLVFSISGYFLAVIIEAIFGKWWSKGLYNIIATWMGMVLVFSVLFFVFDILWLIGLNYWMYGMYILALGVIISILGVINASIIRVHWIKLYGSVKKDYRIVQVSDVHIGPVRSYKFLERIIYKVNKLNPDVVLITGDLFDWRFKYQKQGFKILRSIKAPTYFVMGNHEIYTGTEFVESLLEGTNVKILRNTSEIFKEFQIIGIDDAEDKMQLKKQLLKIPLVPDKYHILMYHRPDNYRDAKGIDLMLAGHTHAGQIFPFNILTWFMSRPVKGLHHYQGINLYVSHGVGTWGPPMRIGCRSEIVSIDLRSKQQ